MRRCEACKGPGPALWAPDGKNAQLYVCRTCHPSPEDGFFIRATLGWILQQVRERKLAKLPELRGPRHDRLRQEAYRWAREQGFLLPGTVAALADCLDQGWLLKPRKNPPELRPEVVTAARLDGMAGRFDRHWRVFWLRPRFPEDWLQPRLPEEDPAR